ncbi:MAG: hypothetical protein PQ964_00510 [Methanobacteriaceae archaeon]
MDEKGYTFTPLVFLLFIPVMIVAISYGEIVEEANTIAAIAIGGDVTHQAMITLISAVEKGTADAGRNAAFNATRTVIDRSDVKGTNPFFPRGQSKTHIINNILPILNVHVITTAREIENQTGREIFINNISIHNHTNAVFKAADINITQTDPFGSHVNIRGGIPIRIVQKDQYLKVDYLLFLLMFLLKDLKIHISGLTLNSGKVMCSTSILIIEYMEMKLDISLIKL